MRAALRSWRDEVRAVRTPSRRHRPSEQRNHPRNDDQPNDRAHKAERRAGAAGCTG